MSDIPPLSPAQLRRRCDPGAFTFETTADLPEVPGIIGQERVEDAVHFAIGIRRYGYNLYALGPSGMGKHSFVRAFLERRAAEVSAPSDWCYVNNFKDARRPRALKVPANRAPGLRTDMERLLEELQAAIPAVFETDEYAAHRKVLDAQLNEASAQAFAEVETRAREQGIALIRAAQGVGLAPLRDGEVIEPDDFKQLPEEEQERFRGLMAELQKEIERAAGALPTAARAHRDELRKLDRRVTAQAATLLVDEVRARWTDVPEVLGYLAEVERDVVDHAADFLPAPEGSGAMQALLGGRGGEQRTFKRYAVNVLVTRDDPGAPVVYEDHPTYGNLVGRIEHVSELGNLVTDFTLIQAGSLLRANGGYLIVDARKLLQQPLSWDELKRALRSQVVRVDSPGRSLSLVSTASLEPEPIPLDLKVVLMGERQLYYTLSAHDPDFSELFKVAADFEEQLERTDGPRPLEPLGRQRQLRGVWRIRRRQGIGLQRRRPHRTGCA